MKSNILLVDDEKNILDAYCRNLRDHFDIATAESGPAALELIRGETVFPVIVTDYKMPGMNGVEFLEAARDVSPDTVQIMLTGQADMQAVIDLINKGKIFRFLTKPCSPGDLTANIRDAIRQYELITAERELLGKTLGGSIRVLTDLLALAKPQAFHRAQRIRSLAKRIVQVVHCDHAWQIEIASMLSQIGCVTIPDDILKKAYAAKKLTDYELVMFQNHPVIAADMLKNIPRLDRVAEIIKYQEKQYDGQGFPADEIRGEAIPLGARILKIAIDFDKLVNKGSEPSFAFEDLKNTSGVYDEALLESARPAFVETSKKRRQFTGKELPVEQIQVGMYLAEDVVTAAGVILGSKNQKVNLPLISTLKNYEKNKQIKGMIRLIVALE